MPIARYFHRRERYFASLNDNRTVRPFEWGKEFADPSFISELNGVSPVSFWKHYAENAVKNSNHFFALSEISDFKFEIPNLTWTSQIETISAENNIARARFFPVKKNQNKKRAVIVLPHWNAQPESYFSLCRVLNRIGISALRLTLPYHEERRPPETNRADYLVSSNIGRTLQSIRQAVLDTKAAVKWLKTQGFERIGIVGTSIGSCTAFLAMVHDADVNVGVFNHVSNYVGDVTWRGISTQHVRRGLENDVSLEELREFWMPVSPGAYFEKLKNQTPRPMRYIFALYDLTFPIDLSRQTIAAFKKHGIRHDKTVLPCGHYTLGVSPWVYLDGWKIVSYFRRYL
ncbi:MAG: alpha/beta hydrolase family protein [Acidobacteriota bacterium]|nr:alpha/beta hydrolase family protein [Acidobacteriota bacterium]